jgi:hypothetical protein
MVRSGRTGRVAARWTRSRRGAPSGKPRRVWGCRRSGDASGSLGWNGRASGSRRRCSWRGRWPHSCGRRIRCRRSDVYRYHDGRRRRSEVGKVDRIRTKRIVNDFAACGHIGRWRCQRGSRRRRQKAGRNSSDWWVGLGDLLGYHAGCEGPHHGSALRRRKLSQALQFRRRDGVAGTPTAGQQHHPQQQHREHREPLCQKSLSRHAHLAFQALSQVWVRTCACKITHFWARSAPHHPGRRRDSHQAVTLAHSQAGIPGVRSSTPSLRRVVAAFSAWARGRRRCCPGCPAQP